jgi:hypothetical protein
MTHDNNHYCEFHKAYTRVSSSFYIRLMFKRLRRYIHHCKTCLEDQIKRHFSYEELNFIRIMILSFHTIIIDFIIALSLFQNFDVILITTNKFFKRINLIVDKETWDVFDWTSAWLDCLQENEWKIFRAIIFDRDSKFLNVFWTAIFRHMKVFLYFTTIYHSSSNEQSEKTNQTIEIVLRFALMNKNNFVKLISFIQISLNNSFNATIDLILNEIFYEFKLKKSLNLITFDDKNSSTSLKKKRKFLKKTIEKVIVFANVNMKTRHDFKKKSMKLNVKNVVYLKLHAEYIQSRLINRKFNKQRFESMKILEKINKLIYKLNILITWKIHSIISIIYLKFASSENDFYERKQWKSNSL